MTIINYVNINNIEKNIETIKSAYEVTAPVDMSSLNKVNIQNFLTPSYSIQVMTYTFSEEFRNTLIINSNNYQLGEITEDISFTIELYNNSEDNLTIENINIVNLYGIDLNLTSQN